MYVPALHVPHTFVNFVELVPNFPAARLVQSVVRVMFRVLATTEPAATSRTYDKLQVALSHCVHGAIYEAPWAFDDIGGVHATWPEPHTHS